MDATGKVIGAEDMEGVVTAWLAARILKVLNDCVEDHLTITRAELETCLVNSDDVRKALALIESHQRTCTVSSVLHVIVDDEGTREGRALRPVAKPMRSTTQSSANIKPTPDRTGPGGTGLGRDLGRERIARVLTALESGSYPQTTGRLRTSAGFDPLGVACDVFHHETGEGAWVKCCHSDDDGRDVFEFQIEIDVLIETDDGFGEASELESFCTDLPDPVAAWLGLEGDRDFVFTYDPVTYLPVITATSMNESGRTFAEIATAIRAEFLLRPEARPSPYEMFADPQA